MLSPDDARATGLGAPRGVRLALPAALLFWAVVAAFALA